ncbi:zinc ABC transporter substrate-binding protein, partial [Planktotalea sp.]|uniref:zinc ABC transporter substrate-binding protein n=1 Tax=Planktotalea sp. TaxID=2029877 RepID=UPI003297EC34
ELLLEPNVSPHSYAMRPSQAVALENADLVVFVSHGLTPWLDAPLDALAGDALKIEVMEIEPMVHHDYRGDGGHHDHGHDDEHEDEHDDHEDEHEEAHDDDHDDHGDDHKDEHEDEHADEHGEGTLDPHGWLDPLNAKRWVEEVAKSLASSDPDNAVTYMANAEAAQQSLDLLITDIEAQIAAVKGRHYMTLHDAFQYFDARFGLEFAGSVALGDASEPSPARIATARAELAEHNVECVFTEPQQSPRLVKVVIEGTSAHTGVLDPMGADLTPGPDLYSELLRGMANSFATCLQN